jgi:DnaJ-domain-containing protein 1
MNDEAHAGAILARYHPDMPAIVPIAFLALAALSNASGLEREKARATLEEILEILRSSKTVETLDSARDALVELRGRIPKNSKVDEYVGYAIYDLVFATERTKDKAQRRALAKRAIENVQTAMSQDWDPLP